MNQHEIEKLIQEKIKYRKELDALDMLFNMQFKIQNYHNWLSRFACFETVEFNCIGDNEEDHIKMVTEKLDYRKMAKDGTFDSFLHHYIIHCQCGPRGAGFI